MPFTGLPETEEFGSIGDDLHLYFEDVYSLRGPERIEWARRAEAAAMAADPRITNSDGGSFDAADRAESAGQLARICGQLSHAAMRECLLLRWRWMRTGRCSAMAGGAARGALRISNLLKPWG